MERVKKFREEGKNLAEGTTELLYDLSRAISAVLVAVAETAVEEEDVKSFIETYLSILRIHIYTDLERVRRAKVREN